MKFLFNLTGLIIVSSIGYILITYFPSVFSSLFFFLAPCYFIIRLYEIVDFKFDS